MEGTMGNEGINKLAGVMQGRMKMISAGPAVLDIGQINDDMSLVTNQFPKPIPQKDYLVCRHLTLGKKDTILTKTQEIGKPNSGTHIHTVSTLGDTVGIAGKPAPDPPDPPDYPAVKQKGDDGAGGQDGTHQHHVLVSEKIRSLKPGDRVLVGWVGDDACVIDIILPGSVL